MSKTNLILDFLYGATGLLWCIFSIGRLIIKKRIFDYYDFCGKNGSSSDFNKKPFNSIIGPFALIYFFKELPSKKRNPEFYADTKTQSLISELKGFSKIFGYLLLSCIVIILFTMIFKLDA
ncbi:hypothetical protein [Labilibaculum antarcticum]|nr:hypothetical protein [Labilibaculum antarcticum]